MIWLNLAVGGLAGCFARYLLASRVNLLTGASFPYGTLVVNVSGCFLIGLFDSLAELKFLLGPNERMLLMTGFCGGYTTFSTLMLETVHLMRGGEWARAAVNFAGSGILGWLLFEAGSILGGVL
jgi:CrcB protein